MGNSKLITSALFVDFDNMYLRLKSLPDTNLAYNFATQPDKWLEWLEKDMSLEHFGEEACSRRILVRMCYLNPASFGQFRPYFTKAAFEVVDCPQLTSQGKTSTDIHLVMDVMDSLVHPSHFDEFIIFSADADFTPVLLRVRKHNRRSVVISVGYSSPAYKSACDYIPPQNDFFRNALQVLQPEEEDAEEEKLGPIIPSATQSDDLHRMAEIVARELSTDGMINAYKLPSIYKEVEGFRISTTWLGYRSLRSLTQAVVNCRPDLDIKEIEDGSWGVQFKKQEKIPISDLLPMQTKVDANENLELLDNDHKDLLNKVAQVIIERVCREEKPVPMGNLAQLVKEKFSAQFIKGNWFGEQNFKDLLEQLDLDGLKIDHKIPGYVYDPRRPACNEELISAVINPKNPIENEFVQRYPMIEPVAKQIHKLTDMPYLLPEHYNHILKQLARAVNESAFHLTITTRLVRDRCVERGAPVARSHVNFIVTGIYFAGHHIGQSKEQETAEELAEFLYQNTLNLCQSAQMILNPEEKQLVHEWLFSCLNQPS